jgi:hypothetical protein
VQAFIETRPPRLRAPSQERDGNARSGGCEAFRYRYVAYSLLCGLFQILTTLFAQPLRSIPPERERPFAPCSPAIPCSSRFLFASSTALSARKSYSPTSDLYHPRPLFPRRRHSRSRSLEGERALC